MPREYRGGSNRGGYRGRASNYRGNNYRSNYRGNTRGGYSNNRNSTYNQDLDTGAPNVHHEESRGRGGGGQTRGDYASRGSYSEQGRDRTDTRPDTLSTEEHKNQFPELRERRSSDSNSERRSYDNTSERVSRFRGGATRSRGKPASSDEGMRSENGDNRGSYNTQGYNRGSNNRGRGEYNRGGGGNQTRPYRDNHVYDNTRGRSQRGFRGNNPSRAAKEYGYKGHNYDASKAAPNRSNNRVSEDSNHSGSDLPQESGDTDRQERQERSTQVERSNRKEKTKGCK